VDAAVLRSLHVEFREAAPIPPLAEAMVGLDEALERLDRCARAGWKHPDLNPAHEALKVREICVEIMRTEEFPRRPEQFRNWMESTRAAGQALEEHLRGPSMDPADRALGMLKRTCVDCHKPYRNARQLK
jgi:hypothetical protein